MNRTIAYLSQGKLYLMDDNAASPREIESEFGRTLQTRVLRMKQKNAWKDQGLKSMMAPSGVAQIIDQQPEASVNVAIASLCNATADTLLYALDAGTVGGIFSFEPRSDKENRLFHNSDFKVNHLDFDPQQNLIACTVTYPTRMSNIATMPIDGARPRDVTEGDSMDLAPRWVPGKRALVFQSAGIARNADGHLSDRAPFIIEKLDFDQQDVITLAEDPKSDLLSPQIGPDGWLYYIRRPYRSPRAQFGLGQFLKDIVLMPLRIVYAIFGFVNFFTQAFTGKPLMNAANGQKLAPKMLDAWGDRITPEMLKDRDLREADAPSLVPRSWQLMRQLNQGEPEQLAEGVLSYDVAADGTVVYTNGSAIYAIALSPQKGSRKGQNRQRLKVGQWIESVRIMSNVTLK